MATIKYTVNLTKVKIHLQTKFNISSNLLQIRLETKFKENFSFQNITVYGLSYFKVNVLNVLQILAIRLFIQVWLANLQDQIHFTWQIWETKSVLNTKLLPETSMHQMCICNYHNFRD